MSEALRSLSRDSIPKFASKIGISESDLLPYLSSGRYSILPIFDHPTHREFWVELWHLENPDWMRYYVGRRVTREEALADFEGRLSRFWGTEGCPGSIGFISLYDGVPSGMVAAGPFRTPKGNPEIGVITLQSAARKGIAGACLGLLLGVATLLARLGLHQKEVIIGTCCPENTASARAMKRNGFVLYEAGVQTSTEVLDFYKWPIPR
jgi:RimJ/RimL family protein N-acetyltransferase